MAAGTITYVGHATTLVELDGTRLLTDPVLRGGIGHIRRFVPAPEHPADSDAVLVSHAHHDHLDYGSLRRLPKGVEIIAPAGVARLIRRWTRHAVTAVAAGDRVRVGAVDVVATPAVHDGRRLPLGSDHGTLGFMFEGTARVYFAGDTDLFDGLRDLAGGIDVALLPIWGWGNRVGPGHMDPERAAQAAAMLEPRVAVPIHWGTLASPRAWWRHDPGLPAREFERLAALHAPGVDVRILEPGDTMALS